MPDSIEIQPVLGPLDLTVRPPGSKSLTNRSLVCAALADGISTLTGALESEDTGVMIDGLRRLGVDVHASNPHTELTVHGCGGRIPAESADLFVANSGTTMRFLTGLASLGHGTFRLDGVPRMRERPIQDLIDTLQQLGVDIVSEQQNDCPPVLLRSSGLPGGRATIRGGASSQFLSAVLMSAPYANRPVVLATRGPLVSQPYVRMTLDVMSAFGVDVEEDSLQQFRIPNSSVYKAQDYEIEPDASAASYFWAAAAIAGGRVAVDGINRNSRQGDVAFCDCLAQMGCDVRYEPNRVVVTAGPLKGIDVDMNAISDTVMTLAAVSLFAEGPTSIHGVEHIRHKETDRIHALACELQKLGAQVNERNDGLTITPAPIRPAALDTYQDHRMAMSLALVGLRVAGVVIKDPNCTQKTYPRFFDDLPQGK